MSGKEPATASVMNEMDGKEVQLDIEEHLQGLEEQFWRGDAAYYRRNLTDDAWMVFAEPVGVLAKDQTIEAIAGSPRWVEVDLQEIRFMPLVENAILLTYEASARSEGDKGMYSALASSVYIRHGDSWKLAFHQQTPSG